MPGFSPYVATIAGVREVALLGLATPDWWQRRLGDCGLISLKRDGCAQLVVSAISARYMGVRFRELCVALLVERTGAPGREELFFVGAFNSSRLFTWFERHWFCTPYAHGQIGVATEPDPSMELVRANLPMLRAARLAQTTPAPAACVFEYAWEGAIHLPARRGVPAPAGRHFLARIAGTTTRFPFNAARDRFEIAASATDAVLQALRDSNFTPAEWLIRPRATHARGKTLRTGTRPAA